MSDSFHAACKAGDLQTVQKIITSVTLGDSFNQLYINAGLGTACEKGHLDIVEYLLTNPDLRTSGKHDIHFSSKNGTNSPIRSSSLYGHLEMVQILTQPEYLTGDLNWINDGLHNACKRGHLDIVDYLLTAPHLERFKTAYAKLDPGFRYACINNRIDLMDYLVSQHQVNIHADCDKAFEYCCRADNSSSLSYLIFEANIPFTKEIGDYLNTPNKHPISNDAALKMFQTRELEKSLQANLAPKGVTKYKNKI